MLDLRESGCREERPDSGWIATGRPSRRACPSGVPGFADGDPVGRRGIEPDARPAMASDDATSGRRFDSRTRPRAWRRARRSRRGRPSRRGRRLPPEAAVTPRRSHRRPTRIGGRGLGSPTAQVISRRLDRDPNRRTRRSGRTTPGCSPARPSRSCGRRRGRIASARSGGNSSPRPSARPPGGSPARKPGDHRRLEPMALRRDRRVEAETRRRPSSTSVRPSSAGPDPARASPRPARAERQRGQDAELDGRQAIVARQERRGPARPGARPAAGKRPDRRPLSTPQPGDNGRRPGPGATARTTAIARPLCRAPGRPDDPDERSSRAPGGATGPD